MHPRSRHFPPRTMGCTAWPVQIPWTRGHHTPLLLKLDFCPSPLYHVTPKYPDQTLPATTGAGKEVTLERVFPKLQHCPLAHTVPRLSQKASLSEFLLHTGPENSTGSRTVPWTQPKLPLLSPNPCTEAKGPRSHQPSHLPAWKGPDIGLIQRRVFLAHLQTASAAPREPITRERNKRETVAISSSAFHQVTRKDFGEPERSFVPSFFWASGSNTDLWVGRIKGLSLGQSVSLVRPPSFRTDELGHHRMV